MFPPSRKEDETNHLPLGGHVARGYVRGESRPTEDLTSVISSPHSELPLSSPRKPVDSLARASGREVLGSIKNVPAESL